MKKKIILLSLVAIMVGCSKTPKEKANELVKKSYRYSFFGNVDKLDSVFGYKEAFSNSCAAYSLNWWIDSTLEASNGNLSKDQREDITSESATAYNLSVNAANITLKNELSQKPKEFVGYSTTKNTSRGKVTLYFNKNLHNVYGVKGK